IELALFWRKHEGNTCIKGVIDDIGREGGRSISITAVKEKLVEIYKLKLIEEGVVTAEESAISIVKFLTYNIKRMLREHSETANPRVNSSQIRDDDEFAFIPRSQAISTSISTDDPCY
ncbi:hypothetical protein ADUPG1_002914, partial [Aduncisulcus paluster]